MKDTANGKPSAIRYRTSYNNLRSPFKKKRSLHSSEFPFKEKRRMYSQYNPCTGHEHSDAYPRHRTADRQRLCKKEKNFNK